MYVKRFWITVFLVFTSLLIVLYFAMIATPSIKKDIRSEYLKGGDFTLLHNGEKLSLSDLKGNPVVLYFGYTFCPDVCPVGLAVLRDVLNSSPRYSPVKVLFITLDPERDTEDVLDAYTDFFHPNILPLRGPLEEIQAVISAYGGFLRHNKAAEGKSQSDYLVDHSVYYYLIDGRGELVRVMDHSATEKEIAETLRQLL